MCTPHVISDAILCGFTVRIVSLPAPLYELNNISSVKLLELQFFSYGDTVMLDDDPDDSREVGVQREICSKCFTDDI